MAQPSLVERGQYVKIVESSIITFYTHNQHQVPELAPTRTTTMVTSKQTFTFVLIHLITRISWWFIQLCVTCLLIDWVLLVLFIQPIKPIFGFINIVWIPECIKFRHNTANCPNINWRWVECAETKCFGSIQTVKTLYVSVLPSEKHFRCPVPPGWHIISVRRSGSDLPGQTKVCYLDQVRSHT